MKLMDRMRELCASNKDAIEASQKVLADASRCHQAALAQLHKATKQAAALEDVNHRNHFSESLTYAFRGKDI